MPCVNFRTCTCDFTLRAGLVGLVLVLASSAAVSVPPLSTSCISLDLKRSQAPRRYTVKLAVEEGWDRVAEQSDDEGSGQGRSWVPGNLPARRTLSLRVSDRRLCGYPTAAQSPEGAWWAPCRTPPVGRLPDVQISVESVQASAQRVGVSSAQGEFPSSLFHPTSTA